MATIERILKEKGVNFAEKASKKVQKTSRGRELINNLMYRLQRRGNVMVKMRGHYLESCRISLSSNFFEPGEKNLHIWVKPFVRGKHLMFDWNGVIFRASDVFGDSINRVKL